MSEIYVEGIREGIIQKFTEIFDGYGLCINYDDSPIRDVVNSTMAEIEKNMHDCIDDVFEIHDWKHSKSEKNELKNDLKKMTNDFPPF